MTRLQDQARLLASLSPILEKLDLQPVWFSHHGADVKADQQQKKDALDLFLELKAGDIFENLTTLSMASASVDPVLLVALVERAPKMEELSLDGHYSTWEDPVLAELISNVSSKGWKALGFNTIANRIGPLTVATILKNSATLENLRLPNCGAFDSKSIQKLLCSAPNLKRLDLILSHNHFELGPYSLMASDIVESTEDWVCLGLETFKCYIGGVPRPDITLRSNGSPLKGIYNSGVQCSMAESSSIQRRVLAQLGRLTKLREVTLGKDAVNYEMKEGYQGYWYEVDDMDQGSYSMDEMGF